MLCNNAGIIQDRRRTGKFWGDGKPLPQKLHLIKSGRFDPGVGPRRHANVSDGTVKKSMRNRYARGESVEGRNKNADPPDHLPFDGAGRRLVRCALL